MGLYFGRCGYWESIVRRFRMTEFRLDECRRRPRDVEVLFGNIELG